MHRRQLLPASAIVLLFLLPILCSPLFAAGNVLIVADEFPQMEVLAKQLEVRGEVASTIVKQTEMPADLASYSTVIVYIHKLMNQPAEKAFIDYAQSGGKLLLLHHSISSGKRVNRYWFPFLEVDLPTFDFSEGGYKWIDPANWQIVDLASRNYITSHDVKYDSKTDYRGSERPAFTLHDSEIYINHVLKGPRTTLLGLRYHDPKTGRLYEQDTAGWYKRAGKGWVLYFMPGHNAREFNNPAYAQILTNAVISMPQ